MTAIPAPLPMLAGRARALVRRRVGFKRGEGGSAP